MDSATRMFAGSHDERTCPSFFEPIVAHRAVASLEAFNAKFASRPFSRAELRLFFASMAAFNRHTIGGIAILAGRLSDEVLPYRPTTGHEIGAYVLDAAVDEYGLRESTTHVQLARAFAEYLDVPAADVESPDYACRSAVQLGDALSGWYRREPVAFSLGVHTASEMTSMKEFMAWHDVFLKFPDYRLSLDLPEFEYMRAHFTHEPAHLRGSRRCVARYLDVFPANARLLREGAESYLELYDAMFHELDTMIFK